ncbi:MAG: DUF4832 domain-containing protein [Sedimentisphaerales bacterium]|nr:DUF4832 domain-containing protein [Sedimentisphaerales bacterium]
MNTYRFLCCCLAGLGFVLVAAGADVPEICTVRPADNGQALVNPQMGWTLHYYSNILSNYGSKLEPADTLDDFPGLSVIYLRLPWGYLEPREGKFTWSVLDTPSQRWIDKGLQIALRISCSESWMRWATPAWVRDAGSRGYDFRPGQGVVEDGPYWEPDYGDPIFLAKLDRFVAALAARYDGNPRVAFVDVGSYGVWGEGHTWASTRREYDFETIKKHLDIYRKHFQKTLLCLSDDFAGPESPGRGQPIIAYALSQGITLRDDSICVQPPPRSWFHAEMAGDFWPTLPVILEHEHYGPSRKRGAWGDGSLLRRAVEEYHASYLSIHWWPREFLGENRPIIDQINRRLGYRLQLREASWPTSVERAKGLDFRFVWANGGVAPCYPGGYAAVTLKDDSGGIVAVFVAGDFNLAELAVAAPGEAPTRAVSCHFSFAPNCRPGDYAVFVSVGSRDGTPQIALPLEGHDGHRRYRLGTICCR